MLNAELVAPFEAYAADLVFGLVEVGLIFSMRISVNLFVCLVKFSLMQDV